MIELRYIECVVPAPEYGENIGKTVKKLQYRLKNQPFLDETGDLKNAPLGWSEWIDVPTVKG